MRSKKEFQERYQGYMKNVFRAMANGDLPTAERQFGYANLMQWAMQPPRDAGILPGRPYNTSDPSTGAGVTGTYFVSCGPGARPRMDLTVF